MVESMAYEPFYTRGSWVQASPGIALGWVCHQGSFTDCLPVWNETRDVMLVFAGEHYPEESEIKRLISRGHQFTRGDASHLVHLYEEDGPAFLKSLNGFFSGVLVDLRQRKILLFNDRYGLNRIYLHEAPEGFYFASEAKALLRRFPALRRLSLRGLGEQFVTGCTLRDQSLFDGISLLPGGACWSWEGTGPVRRESYFDRGTWESLEPLGTEDYYGRMRSVMDRVLPKYFGGGRPVSVSLTGGLDSRMIMAGLRMEPGSIPCFTFGGLYRECADVAISKRVAAACSQPHQVIPLERDFFGQFLDLAQRCVHHTDGCLDVTGAVGLYMNRKSRGIAPVRMTGNYGSEIQRANLVLKASSRAPSMFRPEFGEEIARARAVYAEERRMSRIGFIAFKQVPWHHYSRFQMEQSQLTIRSPFLDNELVRLSFQAPKELAVNKALAHRYIADGSPALAAIPTDRGNVRKAGFLPYKAREWLEEFMPRAEYVFDYGMPPWLARVDRWTAPLGIEKLFLGRQKYYHFRIWYRDELSRVIREVLLDPRTLSRPYLDRRAVERMVSGHTGGSANHTSEIHSLLTTELLQRQLIEVP